MKRNRMRTAVLAVLLLGLSTAVSAREDKPCSLASMAGDWEHVLTGTVIMPTGAAVPAAVVGKSTVDGAGNFSGTQTSSLGGTVNGPETARGTITSNGDCTGTITVGIYDQSGNLIRNATFASVSNGREVHAIMTSLMVGNTAMAPVVILTMKKLLPDRGNDE